MEDCDQWWWQMDLELQALELQAKQLYAITLFLMLAEANNESL